MKTKTYIGLLLIVTLAFAFSGCTKLSSSIKDFQSETLGLAREFHVYDDFGNETMVISGQSTDIQASEVANVLLITIDGKSWEHVGSSMIIAEKGVENIMGKFELSQAIGNGKGGTLTFLDRKINHFVSGLTGLGRVIVVKNQAGVIIGVYEGDSVLVEASALPQSTKILIDGKRLTIYRCDYEIFEQDLLK